MVFEIAYFFDWIVVDSYGNVGGHIYDGHEFCLLSIYYLVSEAFAHPRH